MKKQQRKFGIFLLVVAILVFLWQYNGFFGLLSVGFSNSGVQPIPNPNGGYEFNYLNTPIWICDSDECIVSGSINVNKPIQVPKVVFRYYGNYQDFIYLDSTPGGALESWEYSNSGTKSKQGTKLPFNTPNGYEMYLYLDKLYLFTDSSHYYKYSGGSGGSGNIFSTTPTGANGQCGSLEVCSVESTYSATFNFCPNDPGFSYCSGSKNLVSSSTSSTYFTEEKLIKRNEQVTFSPKYIDNSPVESYSLKVLKGDASCLPAIQQGDACSPEQIYCKPSPGGSLTCPSGYNLINYVSNWGTCDGYGNRDLNGKTCQKSVSGNARCVLPTLSPTYNTYLKCDGSQTIGQSQCGDFNTQSTCPTGQQCYVQGQLTEGLGACSCTPNACDGNSVGYKQALSETTYRECIPVGTCTDWSTFKTCSEGLVFDQFQQKCVFSSENSCSPNEAECVGTNQLRVCEQVTIGGVTGYQWSNVLQNAPGEKLCDNKGNNLPDDSWSCNNVNSCQVGQIQCNSISTYLTCAKNPSDVTNSCYKFRDLGGQVGQYEQCVNNQISQRDDIGCAFSNTPEELKCSTSTDLNNIPVESCVNNECVVTNDQYSATQTNFLQQNTKCIGNSIYKASKITDGTKIFYRWEIKNDAVNTLNGQCKTDFSCVELLSGSASCELKAQFVGIIAKDSYGIGEKIDGVLVSLTNSVPNKVNLPIIARLFDGQTELKRVNTFTDNNGQVTINFDYSHTRGTDLKIDILAGDPNGLFYQNTKTIKIASTLRVLLQCPVNGFVDREVSCSWSTKNLDTNALVTPSKTTIKVTQGNEELNYQPSGTSGVKFISSNYGAVNVKVIVEKDGFISDDDETNVEIESLTQSQSFEVDNKDFFTYNGFTTGTHQFVVKILDSSGQPEKVQSINAQIRTPGNQIVPLSFSKISDGNYKTTYNLQQAGTTYELSGTIVFEDITKESIPFTYSIATIGTATQDDKITIYLIIFVVGAFVIVGIITGIVLLRKKR